MILRLDINGVESRCDTVAEAMALAKHAGGASRIERAANNGGGRASHAEDALQKRRKEQAARSLRFLVAVRDAGEGGVGGQQLVKVVKFKNTAGLGTVKQVTERLLHEVGISLEDVAERRRIRNEKLWFAGSQVQQAIGALEGISKAD